MQSSEYPKAFHYNQLNTEESIRVLEEARKYLESLKGWRSGEPLERAAWEHHAEQLEEVSRQVRNLAQGIRDVLAKDARE